MSRRCISLTGNDYMIEDVVWHLRTLLYAESDILSSCQSTKGTNAPVTVIKLMCEVSTKFLPTPTDSVALADLEYGYDMVRDWIFDSGVFR